MKLTLLLPALLLTGCTTVVPVTSKWPEAPGTLVQEPCPQLEQLGQNPKLSDVATIVVQNYTQYYQCAVKLEAWQRWYREQQAIHKELK
jgi:hypothetical protein